MSDNENTPAKRKGEHLAAYRFQPGNPGRPKGSRNKLGEDFLKAMLEDFTAPGEDGKPNGVEAIRKVREDDPAAYVRTVVSILPKEFDIGENLVAALKESRDAATGAFYRSMAEDAAALPPPEVRH